MWDKTTEVTLKAIIEFVENLVPFEPNFSPLKLYLATCKRALAEGTEEPKKSAKPKPKVNVNKIFDPFRDFVDTYLAFLDSVGTLRILPSDFVLAYSNDKIYIPLGKIMRRVGPDERETFRHHLINIGILVAGPKTNKAKLMQLLDYFIPLPEEEDDEFKLTEMDKEFLGPVASAMPGVDLKMLHKLGMKNLSRIDTANMNQEELTDTVVDGIGTMLRGGFMQNFIGAMTKKAENGEMNELDQTKMMEMMAMSQQLLAQAMAGQGGPALPQ